MATWTGFIRSFFEGCMRAAGACFNNSWDAEQLLADEGVHGG
jgi:hypothetical protein